MVKGTRLPDDWYDYVLPWNVSHDPTAYMGTSYSFLRFRSERPDAMSVGRGAIVDNSRLDIGVNGRLTVGDFTEMTQCLIQCDLAITIADYVLIAWDAVVMDGYRRGPAGSPPVDAAPVRLERNCWVGFGACVLPGVTVGENAIVGAKSVVTEDVPANAIVVGNPARVVRVLEPDEAANRPRPSGLLDPA